MASCVVCMNVCMSFFADDHYDKVNANDDDGNYDDYGGGVDRDDNVDVNDDVDAESLKLNKINSIHKLSKIFFNNELDSSSTTIISSSTTTSSSENSHTDVDGNSKADDGDELSISPHYIYRKRCQMEDDWGTIGLNCTNDDIITERVVVIGFLVNWIKAFIHIKSELVIFLKFHKGN